MEQNSNKIRKKIIQMVQDELLDQQNMEIDDETLLIENLGLDSVQLMDIIVKIEELFHIDFSDSDILFENFNRVGDLCALVETLINNSMNAEK